MTSHTPFDPDKARAWNSLWEKRYAPGYVERDDGQQFPKPTVKPPPLPIPKKGKGPREPHSASVIRELERQINGRVLSQAKGDE